METDEFSEKIGRLTQSDAYLQYCEEVYGYKEYLFNMMDKAQIDFVLNSISISAEDTLLDLGCGSGSMLNLLVAKYGCHGVGIDRLDRAILDRGGNRIAYINADIDALSECSIRPTITLSIDSLYFINDLNGLVRKLTTAKNNRMYFFYSQYLVDEAAEDESILERNNTKIALALQNNEIPYETIEYSENERLLYKNSLRVLEKFKKAFAAEENADLYAQKFQQDLMGMKLYDKGLARRYLYIINGV